MSLLEQQIKELQLKKKKVDLYKLFLEELVTHPKKNEFSEVSEEVLAELKAFVDSQIDKIENGTTKEATKGPVELSDEDKALLLTIARRAKERVVPNHSTFASDEDITVPKAPAKRPQQNPKARNQDMITFAQEHRHLDRKRVTVHTPQGDVGGIVVGAIAPHLIVKTDTGHEVPVSPENITVG